MGLMLLVDSFSESGAARQSRVLWVLLAAAVGLTFWECRERGYRTKITLWWVTFVAITTCGGIRRPALLRPPLAQGLSPHIPNTLDSDDDRVKAP